MSEHVKQALADLDINNIQGVERADRLSALMAAHHVYLQQLIVRDKEFHAKAAAANVKWDTTKLEALHAEVLRLREEIIDAKEDAALLDMQASAEVLALEQSVARIDEAEVQAEKISGDITGILRDLDRRGITGSARAKALAPFASEHVAKLVEMMDMRGMTGMDRARALAPVSQLHNEKCKALLGEVAALKKTDSSQVPQSTLTELLNRLERTKADGALLLAESVRDVNVQNPSALKHMFDHLDEAILWCRGTQHSDAPKALGGGKAAVFGEKRLVRDADGTRQLRLSDRIKDGRAYTSVLEEALGKAFPELLEKFYPRKYENVGQYHSPKTAGLFLANVVAESLRYGYEQTPTAYRLMLPAFKPLVEQKVPTFFISPEILQAIRLTTFAEDINWVDMKLPFEQGVFILPRGGFTHPTDGEVSMVFWSRLQGGETCPPVVLGLPVLHPDNTSFATVALCAEKGIWYDAVLNASYRPTLKMNNLFYTNKGEAVPQVKISNLYCDEELAPVDAPFLEELGVIVFGTFLAMNARPELVEQARMLKAVPAKGSTPRKEFWSPNIIGRKYKIKREVPKVGAGGKFEFNKKSDVVTPGTHASPRMHWRRGHFRNQPYGAYKVRDGKRYFEHVKTIWLEPTLIGAVREDNKAQSA